MIESIVTPPNYSLSNFVEDLQHLLRINGDMPCTCTSRMPYGLPISGVTVTIEAY